MNGRKFNQLNKDEREILSEAWTWLQDNGYPFDVTEDSRYSFLFRVHETLYSYHGADGGVIMAVMECRPYQKPGSDRFELWLQVLFVREQYRRTGVGEFMLDNLIRSCAYGDGLEIGLGTRKSNTAMMRLAEKCQFKRDEKVIFFKQPA